MAKTKTKTKANAKGEPRRSPRYSGLRNGTKARKVVEHMEKDSRRSFRAVDLLMDLPDLKRNDTGRLMESKAQVHGACVMLGELYRAGLIRRVARGLYSALETERKGARP